MSDDYIQGSGLIKTSGSCEVSGLVSPAIGSVVTFNYTKSGITRNVPRKLRVLSSFADPFRRTTKVELGCKLTYLSDLKDPIKWSAFNDPENEDPRPEDAIVTMPIFASSIANRCLFALGISGNVDLTNKFSIKEFDFSPGYVSILSDLLVSECKCGYLDYSENLVLIDLSYSGGSGPTLGANKVIDIGPIGVGDLAGDAVVVSYNTLILKAPEDEDVVCVDGYTEEQERRPLESQWGSDTESSYEQQEATFAYEWPEGSGLKFATYNWLDSSRQVTQYAIYNIFKSGKVLVSSTPEGERLLYEMGVDNPVDPLVERKNLVTSRTTTIRSSAAGIAGGYAQQLLNNGFGFNTFDVFKTTNESISYDDKGNESLRVSTTFGSLLHQYGNAGIDFVYEDENGNKTFVPLGSASGLLERIVVRTFTNGRYIKTVTERYGPWADTISGQQAIANAREVVKTAGDAQSLLGTLFGELHLIDVTTNVSVQGERGEELPSDNLEEAAEDTGDPNNGFSTESSAEIELATGSPLAGRRIELQMPYAPDDTFSRRAVSLDPLRYCYSSVKSDAKAKAKAYGIAQNRLLAGNRNGMNIQTVPELLPTAPFAPFYLSANGAVMQYRMNGTSWTMDSNGIVASTDGLYWGVVGKAA
ncbi:MAG: hypothetical protein ACO24H_05220 [Polynucleobacter sp.]